ncbi:hypothetical protein HG717_32315 [Rhodococcus erythropolis]|uniref:hypothetical protein n=1 Tax=Rhodococcus erythropolis TaxID=1833 RepID=UPI001C9B6A63|nr:hypothetical protein [Rhodococcus erythropolis]MBY6388569.1 hypothetical protein [Rhodococcus erythropolis]
MLLDPVPRRISTAKAASARTERTVVTVRGLQLAARAMRALVTAQWRPLDPSAKRASAALTRANNACPRWTRRRAWVPVAVDAQAATSQVQEVREIHIGVVAATTPAVTIQRRRLRRNSARPSRVEWTSQRCVAKADA